MKKSVIELQQEQEKILRARLELQRQGVASVTDERWVKSSEESRKIDEELELAIEAERIEKRLLGMQAESEKQERSRTDTAPENAMSYDVVFKRFLTMKQNGRLSDDEMRMLETRGTNTQIGSTNSLGGYLVPQSFSNELEMAGIYSGGMMDACRLYADPIGGTLKWPTGDDTATNGEITAQGVARTVQDITFGNVLFSDYTIDSGIVKVGRELINDERVAFLQTVLAELLATRISRKANSVLTNGTGTSEPYGLTVAVTATGITTTGATAITKSELTRLLYSVNRHYQTGPKVGWMMHSQTLGYLRTLDFSTDTTHIFSDLKIAGEPDMLLGYPVTVNNDLPALTNGLPVTATKHVYFGDFSKYVIRRIDGVSIERNDSVYWDKFTAGFMGWTRLDGNLITPNAIKPLLQA
jgi:HK97 family phage major capsid protein